MKNLEWPQVALAAVALAVLGFLSWKGIDATPVIGGVLTLLVLNKQQEAQKDQGALKASVDIIQGQTNGRLTELMSLVEKQNAAHLEAMATLRREQAAMMDRHRADLKEAADKMALMAPITAVTIENVPTPTGETNSPNL